MWPRWWRIRGGPARGYTRLHFMTKKGRNHFTWGTATNKEDILNTLHEDILLKIPSQVPVMSRFLGSLYSKYLIF